MGPWMTAMHLFRDKCKTKCCHSTGAFTVPLSISISREISPRKQENSRKTPQCPVDDTALSRHRKPTAQLWQEEPDGICVEERNKNTCLYRCSWGITRCQTMLTHAFVAESVLFQFYLTAAVKYWRGCDATALCVWHRCQASLSCLLELSCPLCKSLHVALLRLMFLSPCQQTHTPSLLLSKFGL